MTKSENRNVTHESCSQNAPSLVWSPDVTPAELARYRAFVGVDLHKTNVTLRAVDPTGKEIAGLTVNTRCMDRIAQWLWALPRPSWVAVEAVGFVEWFIDRYRSATDRMDIADATRLAGLRGKRRKNDPKDALDIAQRLAAGRCPLGYIAPPEITHLRKLGRHWRRLTNMLARAKHSMTSILHAANLSGPRFNGLSGQRWFLAHNKLLKPADRHSFEDLLEVILVVERQKSQLYARILDLTHAQPFTALIRLLQTVPGIGEIWACIITAEIGPFERFPNADALEFWSGLTADNELSGGRSRAGHITKAGSPTLRWALAEAAMILCQHDPRQEAHRQRLITRLGNAKANVAMARRLLRLLYAMVRDGKPYQRTASTDHLDAANQARRRQREFHRRLERKIRENPVPEKTLSA